MTPSDSQKLAKFVAEERQTALQAYYDSDREDTKELGKAIALLDVQHWLADRGYEVYTRGT